ncbi:MAG: hypothetical protein LBD60_03615 [Puniceicoccales bacterium]|nr:hypothetical protein [Puniceicoccales bacterium]
MLKHILSKKRNALPLVVWSFIVLNGETVCHAAAPESPLTGDFSFNQSGYPFVFCQIDPIQIKQRENSM